jgi:hypothetical protein
VGRDRSKKMFGTACQTYFSSGSAAVEKTVFSEPKTKVSGIRSELIASGNPFNTTKQNQHNWWRRGRRDRGTIMTVTVLGTALYVQICTDRAVGIPWFWRMCTCFALLRLRMVCQVGCIGFQVFKILSSFSFLALYIFHTHFAGLRLQVTGTPVWKSTM